MIQQDWLNSYISLEGIHLTSLRVSHRVPKLQVISQTGDDLRKNYELFRKSFEEFIPDAIAFTDDWKQSKPLT